MCSSKVVFVSCLETSRWSGTAGATPTPNSKSPRQKMWLCKVPDTRNSTKKWCRIWGRGSSRTSASICRIERRVSTRNRFNVQRELRRMVASWSIFASTTFPIRARNCCEFDVHMDKPFMTFCRYAIRDWPAIEYRIWWFGLDRKRMSQKYTFKLTHLSHYSRI